MFAVTNYLRV